MTRCLPLLFLAACFGSSEPTSASQDRDAYAASAAALSTNAALAAEHCSRIEDDRLHGECATFAAKEMGKQRLDGLALCATVRHDGWGQVCSFEAADGAGLIGDEALAACDRSGEFLERCLSHALSRHADRDWRSVSLGQEALFLAWLEEKIPYYRLEDGYQDVRRDFLARRIAERVRRSAAGEPRQFTTATCGTAPAATCSEAYRYLVRGSKAAQDVSALCTAPLTPERLAAAGMPVWTDGEPATVAALWDVLCRELQGAGRPPPHLPPR